MRKDFFDMCAFDLKLANRDRNEDNLALKLNLDTEELSFYELFDNEQILGMQENRVDVKRYLKSDKEFEKFKAKELTSYIGTPQKSQKVQAKELLKYLLQHHPQEILSSLEDMSRYHVSDLEELMDCCEGLSDEHKAFAKKVFLDREKEIAETIKEYKEQEKKTIEPR